MAVLPDWWEDDYVDENDLLPELEVRVARFLTLPTDIVVDPNQNLQLPLYENTKLRRVRIDTCIGIVAITTSAWTNCWISNSRCVRIAILVPIVVAAFISNPVAVVIDAVTIRFFAFAGTTGRIDALNFCQAEVTVVNC